MGETQNSYMLPRDQRESQRLDKQHDFWTEFVGGNLLDPAIPQQTVKAVADVATGTGIWLQRVAKHLDSRTSDPSQASNRYVGFDISDAQFPKDQSLLEFVVHDMTKPFPKQYWETFDVVHVRLLTYGLRADSLDDAVQNVVQLLKPGGYLQWEDADSTDICYVPESEKMKKMISELVAYRRKNGLTHAITQPLLRTLCNLRSSNPISPPAEETSNPLAFPAEERREKVDVLKWSTSFALRIMSVRTYTSIDHPSKLVQETKSSMVWAGSQRVLEENAKGKREMAAEKGSGLSEEEREDLRRQADEIAALAADEYFSTARLEIELVAYVARKGIVVGMNEKGWTKLKHPELDM